MSIRTMKRSRSPSPISTIHKRPHAETPSATKDARFLILSDTHGNGIPSIITDCDVLLHSGDITEDGSPDSISSALPALGMVKAELKLVISGDHEIFMDEAYNFAEGGSESDVEQAELLVAPESTSEASKNSITFLKEGTHTFILSSGASFSIYASPYTPAHGASGFQYLTKEDRYNPAEFSPSWA
jgi:3',5'-cyclic AMP phosphodiesterase CpdA